MLFLNTSGDIGVSVITLLPRDCSIGRGLRQAELTEPSSMPEFFWVTSSANPDNDGSNLENQES